MVAVAVLGSLRVLQAMLAKPGGRAVDRPRIPLLWRLNRRIGRAGSAAVSYVPSTATGSLSRSRRLSVLGLAVPALGMKMHQGTIDTLPQDSPRSRPITDAGELPDRASTIRVVLKIILPMAEPTCALPSIRSGPMPSAATSAR